MEKIQQLQGVKLSEVPQHTYIEFPADNDSPIFFNSKFDSGNLKKVIKNGYDHYSIWTAADAEGTQFEGYPKSWFYFSTGGFKRKKVTFSIHRMHFLWAMSSKKQQYRPVMRLTTTQSQTPQQWQRLPHPIQSLSVNQEQELVLKFDYYFSQKIKSVQFAFTYPYSHEECRKDCEELKKYQNDNDIYVKIHELCKSVQGRIVDLIHITSHQGKDGFENVKPDEWFTIGQNHKLQKFRSNKPVIFITSRVHPIETPSSYTMKGIINFLLNKQDYRAHLLRKYFVFILVPMLNPDGVSNGHCRMDSLNQNLNRYYKNPDGTKQPSCYSITKLGEHYSKEKKLFMYLDLHAHPASKGNFIFGNAIFDYIDQVQSHLFPKILSQNCINFEFEQCIFSRKHMKAKDRNQDMNKEGCGRVVFYKEFGLTHSYTLECGYHCNAYNNTLNPEQNTQKGYIVRYRTNQKNEHIYDNFEQQTNQQNKEIIEQYLQKLNENGQKGWVRQQATKQKQGEKQKQKQKQKRKSKGWSYNVLQYNKDEMDNPLYKYYQNQMVLFTEETFNNLGRNICISILDVWNKNPYTRIQNVNEWRKEIAEKHAKLDRFKKQQAGIKTKQKRIVELIESQCYSEWHKRNVFQFTVTQKQLKKPFPQLRRSQRPKILSQAKQKPQQLSTSDKAVSKISSLKQRSSLLREQKQKQKRLQVMPQMQLQLQLESIKTIGVFEQTQLIITNKLNQLNLERSNFKPLNQVRIRNVQGSRL